MKKDNDEILWSDSIEWMGGESPLIKSAPSKAKIATLDETNTSLEILDCLTESKEREDLREALETISEIKKTQILWGRSNEETLDGAIKIAQKALEVKY